MNAALSHVTADRCWRTVLAVQQSWDLINICIHKNNLKLVSWKEKKNLQSKSLNHILNVVSPAAFILTRTDFVSVQSVDSFAAAVSSVALPILVEWRRI